MMLLASDLNHDNIQSPNTVEQRTWNSENWSEFQEQYNQTDCHSSNILIYWSKYSPINLAYYLLVKSAKDSERYRD